MKHALQKHLQKHPQICLQKRCEISTDTMRRLGCGAEGTVGLDKPTEGMV